VEGEERRIQLARWCAVDKVAINRLPDDIVGEILSLSMTPFGKNMVKLPDEALETSSGTDPKYLLLFIRQEGGEIFVECINLWLPRSAVVPLHVHPAPSFFVQLGDPTCIGRVLLSLTTLKVCASCRSPRNPPPPPSSFWTRWRLPPLLSTPYLGTHEIFTPVTVAKFCHDACVCCW